jgi:HEAT repeat protein
MAQLIGNSGNQEKERAIAFFAGLLSSLFISLVLSCGIVRGADVDSTDPVEVLRGALLIPVIDVSARSQDLAARRQNLEAWGKELVRLPDLRAAVLLREWRDEAPEEHLAAVDQAVHLHLARRFEHDIRDILERGEGPNQVAAANMLAETAASLRGLRMPGWNLRSLSTLVAGLTNSADRDVREAAVKALGQMNPDPDAAVPVLARMLREPNATSHRLAAQGLANMVQSAAQTVRQPNGIVVETSHAEVIEVCRAVIPAVSAGISDSDPEVRCCCLEGLHQVGLAAARLIGEPRHINRGSVQEAETYRREVSEEAAILAPLAADLKDRTGGLTQALADPVPAVRLLAQQTIESLGVVSRRLQARTLSLPFVATTPPVIIGQRPGAGTEIASIRRMHAIQQVPCQQLRDRLRASLPALAERLNDPDVRARQGAIEALEMLDEDAAPVAASLVTALADTDAFVRLAAARTLGKIGPAQAPLAVPGLTRMLNDPDLDARMAGVEALKHFGPLASPAAPSLAAVLNQGDTEFRLAILQALENIGNLSQPAISEIAETLKSSDVRLRVAGVHLLRKYGPAAIEAKKALKLALVDSDEEVRKGASDALLDILPPPVALMPPTGSHAPVQLAHAR